MQRNYFIPDVERISTISRVISTIEDLSAHCHHLKSLLSQTGLTRENVYDEYFDPDDDDLLESALMAIKQLRILWAFEVSRMEGLIKEPQVETE